MKWEARSCTLGHLGSNIWVGWIRLLGFIEVFMSNQSDKTYFEQFLEKQIVPKKPTPKQIEWARDRFSSRVDPPKTKK